MEVLTSRYDLLWKEIQRRKSEIQFESNSKKENEFPRDEETKNNIFPATTSKKTERRNEFAFASNIPKKKLKNSDDSKK